MICYTVDIIQVHFIKERIYLIKYYSTSKSTIMVLVKFE